MYGVRLFVDAKREVLIPMRSTTSMLFSALHAHILLLQQIVFFQVIQIFAIAHSYVFSLQKYHYMLSFMLTNFNVRD